jgi:hypothetical protein
MLFIVLHFFFKLYINNFVLSSEQPIKLIIAGNLKFEKRVCLLCFPSSFMISSLFFIIFLFLSFGKQLNSSKITNFIKTWLFLQNIGDNPHLIYGANIQFA